MKKRKDTWTKFCMCFNCKSRRAKNTIHFAGFAIQNPDFHSMRISRHTKRKLNRNRIKLFWFIYRFHN